ncbi:MAG: stress response translation initiation inhibitor YciH [Candidatus Omnitrophica bacterium]|nr:stress response translation initiation inhibitor YciH [Candidatus Omnitrophota bacterium]MBU1995830.1 stress response translation initiation inhibitor YciH [Candidatus Omnitrophota bacterium]MBU4332923.1 stress response translation initiation inhibitor YciH [Candidatus Omnitrophota bacterium]
MIDIPDKIFPKNERGEHLCFRCQQPVGACDCPSFDPNKPKSDLYMPVLKIDKEGRKGKAVVVVKGLPDDKNYLKELAKKLKMRTGSGGTFFVSDNKGVIEIQGEKKEIIMEVLRSEGFKI